MRAVLDASAFIDNALYGRPHGVSVVEAPTLIDAEVLSVARRLELHTALGSAAASAIVDTWQRLTINRHGLHRLVPRIWELRPAITVSDAAYVALAEALGIPLVTTDRRLARAAECYCDVIVPT